MQCHAMQKMQGGVKAENAHYAERREQATEALAACLKLELEVSLMSGCAYQAALHMNSGGGCDMCPVECCPVLF